jgi:hypothetical protein
VALVSPADEATPAQTQMNAAADKATAAARVLIEPVSRIICPLQRSTRTNVAPVGSPNDRVPTPLAQHIRALRRFSWQHVNAFTVIER